jgi:hypothetical protein
MKNIVGLMVSVSLVLLGCGGGGGTADGSGTPTGSGGSAAGIVGSGSSTPDSAGGAAASVGGAATSVGGATASAASSPANGSSMPASSQTVADTSAASNMVAVKGTVMDGYLKKATVFLDLNDNGTYDTGEPTALTDEIGAYTFNAASADIAAHAVIAVATPGVTVDMDSPTSTVSSKYTLTSPPGKNSVISPITTLVAAKINAGMTAAAAEAAVKGDLGLPTIDVYKNYIDAKKTEASYQQLHNLAAATAELLKYVEGTSGSNSSMSQKLWQTSNRFQSTVGVQTATIKSASNASTAISIAQTSISATIGGSSSSSGGGSDNAVISSAPPALAPVSPVLVMPTVGPTTMTTQSLTMTYLDVKKTDTIASTNASTLTKTSKLIQKTQEFANYITTSIFKTAIAQSAGSNYPKVTIPLVMTVSSRKLVSGALEKFNPVFKSYEKDSAGAAVEREVKCDFSTVEIDINAVYSLNRNNNDTLIVLSVPVSVMSNCSLNYGTKSYVVLESGKAYDVTEGLGGVANSMYMSAYFIGVIQANDPLVNKSNYPLIYSPTMMGSNLIRSIEVDASGKLVITDLTSVNAPLNTMSSTNTLPPFVFDGKNLVGLSASSQGGLPKASYLVYQKGSTALRTFELPSTSFSFQSFFTSSGDIIFYNVNDSQASFQKLDLTKLTVTPYTYSGVNAWCDYTRWIPGGQDTTGKPCGFQNITSSYGDWLMDNTGRVWNYVNGERKYILGYPNLKNVPSDQSSIQPYSKIIGKYAYAANKTKYVRYDMEKNTGVNFDLSTSNYIINSYQMFADFALVDVVDKSTADRKYIELNFTSGQIIPKNTINTGNRSIQYFLPLNN